MKRKVVLRKMSTEVLFVALLSARCKLVFSELNSEFRFYSGVRVMYASVSALLYHLYVRAVTQLLRWTNSVLWVRS